MAFKPEPNTGSRHYKTEPPFTGKLLYNKAKGLYLCGVCGQALFSSETKFDSRTGWPSFYDVINQKAVKLIPESLGGMNWAEVACRHCGSHLGHVFDDAPDQPTGMRYCINSAALDFKADDRSG